MGKVKQKMIEDMEVSFEEETTADFYDNTMEPFNPAEINIVSEPKSLDILIKRIQYEEIDLFTDFQRQMDLWDDIKMSKLIESVLIRFPLPAFYFDASDENNWLVVDGLQRLSTIKKFVIDKTLKLRGLEFLPELNEKGYDELNRTYQRRIEECPITLYMIKAGTPEDVKYSIFKRINTGGLVLNNQEIRHALSKPRERYILQRFIKMEIMFTLLGDQTKRMKAQELVLRFWAFYSFDYFAADNRKGFNNFFDRALADIVIASDTKVDDMEQTFNKALIRCYHLLGKSAFIRDKQGRRPVYNFSLYEVLSVTLAKLTNTEFDSLMLKATLFSDKFNDLLEQNDFIRSITSSTDSIRNVEMRYSKINRIIQETINA